jgi:hypothetical protein
MTPLSKRVNAALPDDALMIGLYTGESGLPQFKEDLRETIAECGL